VLDPRALSTRHGIIIIIFTLAMAGPAQVVQHEERLEAKWCKPSIGRAFKLATFLTPRRNTKRHA
jgi:hypothetical protein